MKTLILLRHGKSDWDTDYDDDHERPLAERGRSAAALMGTLLARVNQAPQRVLCSSAVRACETVRLAVEAGGWSCSVTVVPEFYGASTDAVLARVATEDDAVDSLLLAGHEPVWSALAADLIGGGELRFPTAAMARIDFEVDRWSRVRPATGSLVWFVIPRLLKAAGLC